MKYQTNYIPIIAGEKRPALTSWKDRAEGRPEDNDDEVRAWLAERDAEGRPTRWLAAICGETSDDLCLLDFDRDGVFDRWKELVDGELLASLAVVSTQTRGRFHVWFRCREWRKRYGHLPDVIAADTVGPLIEWRSGVKYGLVPCQNSGDRYQYIGAVTVDTTPVLSVEDADILIEAAQAQHSKPPPPDRNDWLRSASKDLSLPGNDFADQVPVQDIIARHGWTLVRTGRDGTEYWLRPGKRRGQSATVGRTGENRLYVFSTAAGLGNDGPQNFTSFALHAILDHKGDFVACAKALRAEGYGQRERDVPIEDVEDAVRTVRAEAASAAGVLRPTILSDAKVDAQWRKIWARTISAFEDDDQKYDHAIAQYLFRHGIDPTNITRALYHHRKDRALPADSMVDVEYLTPILRATQKTRPGDIVDAVRDSISDVVANSDDPLKEVRDKLGLDIVRVTKRGRQDAIYTLHLADGESVRLGGIDVLDSHTQFRRRVADLIGRFPLNVNARFWHVQIANPLLAASEFIEDDEWELDELAWQVVLDYVRISHAVMHDIEGDGKRCTAAASAGAPFIRAGHLYISQGTLYRRVVSDTPAYRRAFPGGRSMTTALEDIGFEHCRAGKNSAKYMRKYLSDQAYAELFASRGAELPDEVPDDNGAGPMTGTDLRMESQPLDLSDDSERSVWSDRHKW